MRVASALSALLFAYAAALQWNDPDPVRWMAIYGTAAVVAGAAAFRPVPRAVGLALAAVALLWAATLVPGVVSEAALTGTEEERELAGLLLVAGFGLALARWGRR